MEEFYDKFFMLLNMKLDKFFISNSATLKNMMAKYSFYSLNDAKFRVVRNELLSKKEYDNLMFLMFEEKKFIPEKHYNDLFFKKSDLIQLHSLGHLIGLHSHNHPTTMEKLNYEKQKEEYQKNLDVFSEILNVKKSEIKFMSHPCGSYNDDTLEILKNLGIKLGFKQIMKMELNKGMKKINNSSREIARQDHVEIIKMMNK